MNQNLRILSDLGQAALGYAEQGLFVFPIEPGHKGEYVPDPSRPRGERSTHILPNGHLGASSDPAQVRKWWTANPDANIGLYLAKSCLVAVDVDLYKPECQWTHVSAGLEIPDTLVQRSARGGIHYIFRADPGEAFEGNLGPGVDVKHKGYILVEPSRFEGGTYQFQTDDEPAPAPDWVPRKVARKPSGSERGPATPEERVKVLALLGKARNRLDRDAWVRLCAALKGTLGESARPHWIAFCDCYEGEQKPGEAEREWDSMEPKREVGLGTIFHLLRQDQEAGPGAGSEDQLELTEDGVARAFTARFQNRLRFDHEAGAWFEWMGDHWRRDGTGLAFQFAREVARKLSEDGSLRDQATARKKGFAAGVEAFARVDRAHAVTQGAWDRDPFLLGVPGGVVDLRTGRLRGADPADGITKRAAVAPAAAAECPLWLAFLHQATGGDLEVVAFLRRWLGYCLTGDTREHALIFVYGPGGNGKSVLLNTAARVMGDYATTAAMDTFTTSKGDKHPTELALLRGARMVTASETEEGRAWAEARIKQMTGGDPITARFMRQDFFTYQPQFKLTIVGNHAPALANVDDAARRRFNILPFVRKPPNPDRELETKLESEWPGILRWMIDGAVEWLQDGLGQPESIRAATADYFSEQDVVARWLEERCTLTPANPTHFETAAELFASWSEFAKAAGEAAGSQKGFAPKLRRHGLRQVFRWVNGRSVRAWEGIELVRPKGHHDE